MSSSSYGVLVTWHNSMSSCKFWKIFSTLLTLHFVSILILWFCYLSVEIKIGIVGINRYFFLKVCIYKEVKNTESSYVGVGYTDCLGQMSASFQIGILILRCNPTYVKLWTKKFLETIIGPRPPAKIGTLKSWTKKDWIFTWIPLL